MPIPQIARNPNAQPEELLGHAYAIGATIHNLEAKTDRLLHIALAISKVGSALLQTLRARRDQGDTVIDSVQRDGRLVFVEPAIAALESSSDTLFDMMQNLSSHARAYEQRLNLHTRTMNANLPGVPFQAKVIECENHAIRVMNRQKNDLQCNMPAIYKAEVAVVDLHNLLTDEIICMELLPATQSLNSWL